MDYTETLSEFETIVRNRAKDRTMVALIIDSPWLPGYAGINTLDFFFDPEAWLQAYLKAHEELQGAAFVPDMWVEFGMAAEPSGWGTPLVWNRESPPSLHPFPGGLAGLLDRDIPDPERDGLMPVALRQYERMMPGLKARGIAPRMAAARGPLAVASHLVGLTELLMATQLEPENCLQLFNKTTDLCISWLRSQLGRMENPLGILVLDDVVGMFSPEDGNKFAFPLLKRIFDAFPGMIRIYHNDTPNRAMLEGLAKIKMDVFNFSHEVDMAEARSSLGPDVVLMGNIPPLDVLVRGSKEDARKAAEEMLAKSKKHGPVLISPGGGVSPGTPVENLQALKDVVKAG